jgi:DNA-directed RNA polymerase specialized sigma subunit
MEQFKITRVAQVASGQGLDSLEFQAADRGITNSDALASLNSERVDFTEAAQTTDHPTSRPAFSPEALAIIDEHRKRIPALVRAFCRRHGIDPSVQLRGELESAAAEQLCRTAPRVNPENPAMVRAYINKSLDGAMRGQMRIETGGGIFSRRQLEQVSQIYSSWLGYQKEHPTASVGDFYQICRTQGWDELLLRTALYNGGRVVLTSFDQPLSDGSDQTLADSLPDERQVPPDHIVSARRQLEDLKELYDDKSKVLTTREKQVLAAVIQATIDGRHVTNDDIGRDMNIVGERVRQIKSQIREKLRRSPRQLHLLASLSV